VGFELRDRNEDLGLGLILGLIGHSRLPSSYDNLEWQMRPRMRPRPRRLMVLSGFRATRSKRGSRPRSHSRFHLPFQVTQQLRNLWWWDRDRDRDRDVRVHRKHRRAPRSDRIARNPLSIGRTARVTNRLKSHPVKIPGLLWRHGCLALVRHISHTRRRNLHPAATPQPLHYYQPVVKSSIEADGWRKPPLRPTIFSKESNLSKLCLKKRALEF